MVSLTPLLFHLISFKYLTTPNVTNFSSNKQHCRIIPAQLFPECHLPMEYRTILSDQQRQWFHLSRLSIRFGPRASVTNFNFFTCRFKLGTLYTFVLCVPVVSIFARQYYTESVLTGRSLRPDIC